MSLRSSLRNANGFCECIASQINYCFHHCPNCCILALFLSTVLAFFSQFVWHLSAICVAYFSQFFSQCYYPLTSQLLFKMAFFSQVSRIWHVSTNFIDALSSMSSMAMSCQEAAFQADHILLASCYFLGDSRAKLCLLTHHMATICIPTPRGKPQAC